MNFTFNPCPWIYINGNAGIGKLTIARELQKLIPGSQVMHNHLVIDLCATAFKQGSPEYETLRTAVRREVLEAISTSETGRNTTYIFTGSHGYRLAISPMIPRQHMDQAVAHNIPFISVILTCEEEEHMRRATSADRTGNYRHQSKLTDIQVLKGFRNGGELFTFQCEYEMKADITNLSAIEAAQEIYKFVMDCMTKATAQVELV